MGSGAMRCRAAAKPAGGAIARPPRPSYESRRRAAADAAKAGFEGAPDASARYSSLSNMDNIKKMDEASSTQNIGGY